MLENTAQSMGFATSAASTEPSVRPVPRISIQAFCEAPETASAVQQAALDRRVSKTHFNLQMGGIAEALSHFSDSPTPNLLIIESRAEPSQVLAGIDQLAQVCDSGTKVMVIGHANDIVLYRELMERGVSEYIVAPIMPLQLIDSIANIYLDPDAPVLGRSMAFVGAKGGVGSSTIAHNVSWIVSQQLKQDMILADFDVAFGTVGLDFNQDPPQGIAEVLGSPERIDETMLERLLTKCSEHLNLLTAPGTLDRETDYESNAFEPMIDIIRQTTPLLAIDLPHIWTGWARRTLLSADEVVITAAPDLANLRNARNLVDVLQSSRQNDAPPLLVINMVGMPKRPEIAVKDFTDALGIEPSLVIAHDPQLFGTAANNGQMIEELSPGSGPAEGFRELTRILTGQPETSGRGSSILAPLLKKLSKLKG